MVLFKCQANGGNNNERKTTSYAGCSFDPFTCGDGMTKWTQENDTHTLLAGDIVLATATKVDWDGQRYTYVVSILGGPSVDCRGVHRIEMRKFVTHNHTGELGRVIGNLSTCY